MLFQVDHISIENVLRKDPLNREDRDPFPRLPINVLALLAEGEPGLGHEVDRLSDVQARGEAAVIRSGVRDHELSWPL